MKLKIEYVPKEQLRPYANNAKIHTAEQVEHIKKSIEEFGFNDPIAIWKDDEVVEGHGRLLAVMEMDDMDDIPVIRLDHLTDEQRRAYILVHNKLTTDTGFIEDILNLELDELSGFDMGRFGFDDISDGFDEIIEDIKSKYTTNVKVPQYEIKGELPDVSDLYDASKPNELIEEIINASIPQDVKDFLIFAAYRHTEFNYKNIAEFYAHQDKVVQELMEKSALVIIDFDDAIANGYARLEQKILDQIEEDDDDE